ncbi:cytochrome P450 [Haematococcus lacustris]
MNPPHAITNMARVLVPSLGVAAVVTAGLGLLMATCVALYPAARWRYRKIPGPTGLPLAGNLLSFTGDGKSLLTYVQAMQAKYGKFWSGPQAMVVVAEPDLARRLMCRWLARPDMRTSQLADEEQGKVMKHSLIGLRGPAWRVARKAFEAALMHKDALALHLEVMEQCVARLLARLARITAAGGGDGAIVDVAPLMSDLTMDVVGSCAFGVAFNTQEQDLLQGRQLEDANCFHLPHPTKDFVHACRDMFDASRLERASKWAVATIVSPAWTAPAIRWLARHFPDARYLNTLHTRQIIIDTCKALIQAHQEAKPTTAEGLDGAEADLANGTKRSKEWLTKSFLGQLLEGQDMTTGTTLDVYQIIAQVFVFLMAGFETTAASLTFALYLLAANPEAQRKLQAEVDGQAHLLAPPKGPPAAQQLNGGDHKRGNGIKLANGAGQGNGVHLEARAMSGGALTAEELARSFPYTCAVVDEALRLYPPGAGAIRAPPEATELLGYTVPAEAFVFLPIYSFHHDANVWPDAAEFRPERHLAGHPDAMDATAKTSFMPFGLGPRGCPGSRFALQEARLALASLASRFAFELAPTQEHPVRCRTSPTMAPLNGMSLRVRERA